ncbi:high-potential iron-sulfur protein [Guyparkeria hydrothermalis]|uniref:high-potential iron-sulfur protein n=1 Tax=Guyparkeria hydrothermalis TaxID=923 RepID=UPI00202012FF|nr:high-potential iron-sulfur protein [Guyparkeria hydrothermalis]MCL7744301.1 high-potential iron-sulfur protein [Guyparkeria hydrothermalis]
MKDKQSRHTDHARRRFVGGALASAVIPLMAIAPARAEGLAELSEDDPMAKSLDYRHDASEVQHASYKSGQTCANCALYKPDQAGDGWGGCAIFRGKAVKGAGWCSSYVKG